MVLKGENRTTRITKNRSFPPVSTTVSALSYCVLRHHLANATPMLESFDKTILSIGLITFFPFAFLHFSAPLYTGIILHLHLARLTISILLVIIKLLLCRGCSKDSLVR